MNRILISTPYKVHPCRNTEKVDTESKTKPNEGLSVRQILDRYAKGLPLGGRVPQYFDDEFVPDFDHMDLAEIEELSIAGGEQIRKYKKAKEAKEEKERQKAYDKEVERRMTMQKEAQAKSVAAAPNASEDK